MHPQPLFLLRGFGLLRSAWLIGGVMCSMILGSLASAQAPYDSLRAELQAQPDSLRASTYFGLANAFQREELWDSVRLYTLKSIISGQAYGDSVTLYNALYRLGFLTRQQGDTLRADSITRAATLLQSKLGYGLEPVHSSYNNTYWYTRVYRSLMVLEDTSGILPFDSVLQIEANGGFRPNPELEDVDPGSTYWVRLRMRGHEDSSENVLFMIGVDDLTWDSIQVYIPDSEGSWLMQTTGKRIYPRDKTGIKDWRSMFYVDMPAGTDKTIYLRLDKVREGRKPEIIFLAHLLSNYLTEIDREARTNMGIFVGILLVQGVYFFLLFLSTGERTYLPYLVYLFGVTAFALTAYKYAEWFPLYVGLNWFIYFGSVGIAGLGLLSFALRYLNIKVLLPKWFRWTRWFQIAFAIPPLFMILIMLTVGSVANWENSELLETLSGITVSILFLMISLGLILTTLLGVLAFRKKYRPAGSYLVGMVVLILFVGVTPAVVVIRPLWLVQILTFSNAILMAQVGIVLQLTLFALGVGQKIKLLEKEHAQALEDKLGAEQDANERLRQADKLKDEFLANTSHELRTPLNGILGLTEAIYDGVNGPVTADMKENLGMVMNSARRLSGLVNDLLDFSKLKNFDLELQLKPIDFRSLSQVVLKVSESLLGGKSLVLKNEIDVNLPAVQADENRLQQILYNLLGNAIKFTNAGSVTLRAFVQNNRVVVEIEDTGIGIPQEQLETVFQSFEQGDGSTAREFGGTGLGLSITRQLVELHGGQIKVKSEVGKGSTFAFDLPVSDATPDLAEAGHTSVALHQFMGQEQVLVPEMSAAELEETFQPLAPGAYRILVVDDEPINRQVLKNHLSTEDYLVTTVMNGVEALEAIDSGQHFDLVLLDVMMPRLSGFEVCQRIREKYPPSELPIIMVTAKNQVNDLVTGLTQGANDYIVKPFSKQEILARIRTHLNLLNINSATSRFVPYEFLRALGKETITEVRLGDQVARTGTVLFSDIRGYTRIAERMSPDETFAFINAYLGRMGPVIQQNKGFVNQFYGDGIMALFLREPEDALKAAIGMMHTLHHYNQERKDKQRDLLHIGVGLHVGSLMMGMIGDTKRLDTGLIADTVNITSRLEGLTKHFGVNILLTEQVYDKIDRPEEYDIRYLGKVLVKGRQESLSIYECFSGDPALVREMKLATRDRFEEALQAYFRKDISKAIELLAELVAEFPEDLTANHFLEKARQQHNGPDDGWSGVEIVQEK